MRIIAVEDEPIFANAIKRIVEELGHELVGITDNAEEMMRFFISLKPDLALMDIHIKGSMNGIEVAKKMTGSAFAIPIIFITSYADKHIFEAAKEANPYAYIIKPINPQLLQHTIELAFSRYSKPNHQEDGQTWKNDVLVRHHLFVKTEDSLQKVIIKDIVLIEVFDKYCQITTTNSIYEVRMSLKEIEAHLPASDFVQIHRSAIINANFIESISMKENTLFLLDKSFDISRRFKENLLSRLNTLR